MPQHFDSKEFLDAQNWSMKSKKHNLQTLECISTWTDVCGFGNLLQNNDWDLNQLQNAGLVELLNEVYSIASRVFLPNIHPLPSDKIIVLNDGIAKTIDLTHKNLLDGYNFLFFLRDTIINHYILLSITEKYKVGIRTILAGGERVQYSPDKITGQSILTYDENKISEHGKKILGTQFLYNPAEFQMNTAFAKAFTIDSLGTKEGIFINGFYIESLFLSLINGIPDLNIQLEKSSIDFSYKGTLMFKLSILDTLKKTIKGLNVEIFHIDKFFIYKEFDGDDLEFSIFKKINKTS